MHLVSIQIIQVCSEKTIIAWQGLVLHLEVSIIIIIFIFLGLSLRHSPFQNVNFLLVIRKPLVNFLNIFALEQN
jgi:hypothetical protein